MNINTISRLSAKTSLRPYYCTMCSKVVKNIIRISIIDKGVNKDTWLCQECFNKLFSDN